jgi:N-acetylmuramoyl-L-alanine amidase
MRILIILLCAMCTHSLTASEGPKYHSVKARNGDGVFSLLRRYDLLGHNGNVRKFYEINDITAETQLIHGQEYALPILVFNYDGKSIRSTIGIDDWDMAVRIATYNNRITERGLRGDHYLEDGVLWVPEHEILAVRGATRAPVAESSKARLHVPLFGENHAEVTLESAELQGKAFYIVSGHGGPDPGAMSELGGKPLCEDEYAYDVSLRLARNLMAHGATVEIIIQDPDDGIRSESILDCDKEELCLGETVIPLWQVARLKQRTFTVNKLYKKHRRAGIKEHTVICIHVDSRSPLKRQDVFFYYYPKSKSGKKLADGLQQTFREKYKENRPNRNYHGTVTSRELYVLKFTDPPAVYVELANIRNAVDLQRILPESNRQALANWLFEGLTR